MQVVDLAVLALCFAVLLLSMYNDGDMELSHAWFKEIGELRFIVTCKQAKALVPSHRPSTWDLGTDPTRATYRNAHAPDASEKL